MKWMNDLKIATKILGGFMVVVLIASFIGIVGYKGMSDMEKCQDEIALNRLPSIEALLVINEVQTAVKSGENALINPQLMDMELRKAQYDYIDSAFKRADEAWKTYEAFSQTKEEEEGWNQFVEKWNAWKSNHETIVNLTKEKDKILVSNAKIDDANIQKIDREVFQKFISSDEVFYDVEKALTKLIAINGSESDKAVAKARSVSSGSATTLLITLIAGVLIAIGLGVFISRIISNPVRKMVEAADKLALGDVSVDIQVTGKDEIGILMRAFDRMVGNIREQALAAEKIAGGDLTVKISVRSENDLLGKKLSEMVEMNNEIINSINSAAEQVAAGARQISASSQLLSEGSTEQASSIEEITSSMTESAAQTRNNAMNANQANELALAAKGKAVLGNEQMKEMLKAMQEINESSSSISRIIKVIDEIAFQTNILALNAAVEAARAGQHGKGFAVVAEEVRNLAARSANAAKETTEMIEGSIKKVDAGTKIANDTAQALSEIVNGIAKAAELVGEIATASNEQATAISQVNQALEQVADVVQTNSATAEEGAAASEELSGQAELLKNTVGRFKLKQMKVSSHESLNPDMIRMIEEMVEKKKGADEYKSENNRTGETTPAKKSRIILEDKEFGKY